MCATCCGIVCVECAVSVGEDTTDKLCPVCDLKRNRAVAGKDIADSIFEFSSLLLRAQVAARGVGG